MHKQKLKFIPLFVALTVVLCCTWALAAGGVFETAEAAPAAAEQAETAASPAGDNDTVNVIFSRAEERQEALSALTDAAKEFDKITAAVEGTDLYYWMCSGENLGVAVDAMTELTGRRAEICESVKMARTLIEQSGMADESAEYADFINSGISSLRACITLEGYVHEIETVFEGYDLHCTRVSYEGDFRLTAYCPCSRCCGIYSNPSRPTTASGTIAQQGRTVAADSNFEFGTVLYIDGLGLRTVEDRGGAIKGNRIDVYMDRHSDCMTRATNRVAPTFVIETGVHSVEACAHITETNILIDA